MTRPYLIRRNVQLHAREASAAPAASFKRPSHQPLCKLPRYGILGCLNLGSSSLGRPYHRNAPRCIRLPHGKCRNSRAGLKPRPSPIELDSCRGARPSQLSIQRPEQTIRKQRGSQQVRVDPTDPKPPKPPGINQAQDFFMGCGNGGGERFQIAQNPRTIP